MVNLNFNLNLNVSINNRILSDTGTFSVTGLLDTITVTGNSTITVTPISTPSNETFYLGATTSTIIDSLGSGDIINGHGTENITLGSSDTTHLFGGKAEIVTAVANNRLNLGDSGVDTITLTGNANIVNVGATGSSITITSGGGNVIDFINGGHYTGTYTVTDNGSGSTLYSELATLTLSGNASDTVYALKLGTHTLTLGTGNNTIITRDGTVSANHLTMTVHGFVDGHDTIELTQGAQLLSSTATIMNHIADVSGNATLTLGGETITFAGVATAQLHASDFTIV